jgi:hypothetical protein
MQRRPADAGRARRGGEWEAQMRVHVILSGAALALAVLGLAVLGLAVVGLPARADDVPVLQVEQVCHGIVDQSGGSLTVGDPKVAFDQCMAGEKSDRETLSKEWGSFTADDKRHCTAETKMGGESSYTELITCLEMARDVRSLHSGNGLTKMPTPGQTPAETPSAAPSAAGQKK